jgi:GSH-dependent disulfide-bond oxidoreductase
MRAAREFGELDRREHDGAQVERKIGVDRSAIQFDHGPRRRRTGVADEDIQRAVDGESIAHDPAGDLIHRKIPGDDVGAASRSAYACGDFLNPLAWFACMQNQFCAVGSKALRNPSADSTRGSGDQRNSVGEKHRHIIAQDTLEAIGSFRNHARLSASSRWVPLESRLGRCVEAVVMIELLGMSSPNVRKIVIALEELGCEYQIKYIEVIRGEQFSPEFLAVSPFAKVPVLIDHAAGDVTVFESGAILIYLAETYGNSELLPKSGAERYATLQWLAAQIAAVGPLLGQNNHFLLLPGETASYAARRYAEQARRIYRVLDDRLKESPWLAGHRYSIADIATYPWALYVPRHGLQWENHPALKEWCDRVGSRPAVARAAAALKAILPRDVDAMKNATPQEIDRFMWREAPGPAVDFSLAR